MSYIRIRQRAQLLILGLALVITGCASQRSVQTDYDQKTDFSHYQTFAFLSDTITEQTTDSDESEKPAEASYLSLNDQHFRTAIQQQMAALGYQYSDQQPQLLVHYDLAEETREVVRNPAFQVNAGYGVFRNRFGLNIGVPIYNSGRSVRDYKVGTVTVDVIDATEKRLVWQGITESRLTKEATENPQAAISETIQLIYETFPYKP